MFSVPVYGMNFGKCCGRFLDCPPLDDRNEASDIENLSTGKTEVFLPMLWNHCCSAGNIFEQDPLDDPF